MNEAVQKNKKRQIKINSPKNQSKKCCRKLEDDEISVGIST
jgi:hypothetical protein